MTSAFAWLGVAVLTLFALLGPAAAAPPVSPPLLAKLERDVAGALTHVAALRVVATPTPLPPDPSAGIAPGSEEQPVLLATLRATLRSLAQRLAEIRAEVRPRRDPRVAQIVWLMEQELGRLQALLQRIESPSGAERERSIAELEHGLVQLDGAVAALRTSGR